MKRHLLITLILLSCLLSVVALPVLPSAQTATSQASALEMAHKMDFVPGDVLVRFRQSTALANARGKTRVMLRPAVGRAIAAEIQSAEGVEMIEGLRVARVAADDTLEAVAALNARPDVLYAEPNYIWRHDALTPNDPRFPEMWALRNTGQNAGTPDVDIDADEAWDITHGSDNVVVGIVDSGIDISHPDLQANIWTNPGEIADNGVDDDGNGFIDDVHGWDFFHNDASVYDPTDICAADPNDPGADAHGTHVAGTIGASGNNGVGVVGVNWNVKMMPLKFLGPCGQGPTSAAISAISYALSMKSRGVNLRVLNNSWGGVAFSRALQDAVSAANASDVLFVAAAGNDNQDNFIFPHFPANYDVPNVISVASTDRLGRISGFSNFGIRAVTMAAPGEAILSTTPNTLTASLAAPRWQPRTFRAARRLLRRRSLRPR